MSGKLSVDKGPGCIARAWERVSGVLFAPAHSEFMCANRNLLTVSFGVVWLVLDAIACAKADTGTMSYLTNQVWVFGMCVRAGIVATAFAEACKEGCCVQVSRVLGSMWLVVGAAQWGIMFTFFLLLAIDSGPMNYFIRNQGYTETQVMLWNHGRHVTPVFLHTLLSWEKQRWVRFMTRTEEEFKPTVLTFWGTIVIPLVIGGSHMAMFDDKTLYHYDESRTTGWCALCFVAASTVMGQYLIHIGNDQHSLPEDRGPTMSTKCSRPAYRVVGEDPPLKF
jgi:hypothetical protein